MCGPIKCNAYDWDEDKGADDDADHAGVHIHRLEYHTKMVEAAAEEEFEEIGKRYVHETDEGKIGEMGKEEGEKQAGINFKCPPRRYPVKRVA